MRTIDTMIVGAGPYGLAVAKALESKGVECVVAGIPMNTWRTMPEGLLLRSRMTPRFDPFGDQSFATYVSEVARCGFDDKKPISREFFLAYADWFVSRLGATLLGTKVAKLSWDPDHATAPFVSELDGEEICSRRVVVASGLDAFAFIPECATALQADVCAHSSHCYDFKKLKGKNVFIIGGRQGAFEWAALLHEAGAAAVMLAYRHETPVFEDPDWSSLADMIDGTRRDPLWFKKLSMKQRELVVDRVSREGRRRLEAGLAKRVSVEGISMFPNSTVSGITRANDAAWVAHISSPGGVRRDIGGIDFVICATGYKPSLRRVPFLSQALLAQVAKKEGYPILDETFQSSVAGLYFVGILAEKDFGPLLGFMNMSQVCSSIVSSAIAS